LAGIVLAAAFLEGGINELFLSAADKDTNVLPGSSAEELGLLSELWELLEDQRAAPLRKVQVALQATRRAPFEKGAPPFQSAENLFRLRNAVVHYKPEWDDELDVHGDLQKRLKGQFADNPLVPVGVTWFPHRCIGAGCARWTCESGMGLLEEFIRRLGAQGVALKYIGDCRAALAAA
jgi:hypothetical protein